MQPLCGLAIFPATPSRGKSQPLTGPLETYFEVRKIVLKGGCYTDFDACDRGGASTRFHPKRRASTDHRPGPNIASAPAIVPRNKDAHTSVGKVNIWPTSIAATRVPATGVQRPGTIRMPDPARTTHVIIVPTGKSPLRNGRALKRREEPTTNRIRSSPIPGQPPANVEYKRRKKAPFYLYQFLMFARESKPQKQLAASLFRGLTITLDRTYSSIIPRLRPIVAAWVRSLALNFDRMHFTRLFTVSSVIAS